MPSVDGNLPPPSCQAAADEDMLRAEGSLQHQGHLKGSLLTPPPPPPRAKAKG